MLPSKNKNVLPLFDHKIGNERREEILENMTDFGSLAPKAVSYRDIDISFKEWVENELEVFFEDKKLPTFTLISNQRFSEYGQTWDHVDENKNLLLNFKTITRNNNPKGGTIHGDSKNIPSNEFFELGRRKVLDRDGASYYEVLKMRQPISIDFNWKITILTNKYELLNSFNLMVNEKFKSINAYIAPYGHYMPMKLESVNDESEYSADDRRFFSQTYDITVMGYIIREEDIIIEEESVAKLIFSDSGLNRKGSVDMEEMGEGISTLMVNYDVGSRYTVFNIDCDFDVNSIELNNISSYQIFVNDEEAIFTNNLLFYTDDEIKIKIMPLNKLKISSLGFIGKEL